MNLLRLTQTSTQPGTFNIRIQLQIPDHNPQTADADFAFSLSDDQQERFRWYLEDFLQYPQHPAGKLDCVIVFNLALSDDEIMALYNSQSEDTVLHDEAGNLVMDQKGYQYEYDHDNRLTKITQDTTDIAAFTYDALGRRIEKIEYDTPNLTTRYYYDGWRVLSETNAAGEIQRDYVYGNYLDDWRKMSSGLNWKNVLREAVDECDVKRIRLHTHRGRPLGSDNFLRRMERRLGHRIRSLPVGLPRKKGKADN